MKKYKIKSAKTDFTEQHLPGDRKALFWDCIHVQFPVILRISLLCAVFMIPYLVAVMVGDSVVYNANYAAESLPQSEVEGLLRGAQLISSGLKVIALALFFIPFSGIVQIVRQLLWQEPLFLWDDFKNGVKNNAITFMLTAFTVALPEFVLSWNQSLDVMNILKGICAVSIVPIGGWIIVQAVYYRLSIFDSLRNSIVFYVKAFPATLLLEVLLIVPFYLVETFVMHLMVRYLLILISAIILIVPLTMVSVLYANNLFDLHINKEHYPQLYRKGLRPESEEGGDFQ